MGRLLTLLTLAVLATPAAYGQNGNNGKGNNNGARVGKAGFLLNVHAHERCPRGEFRGSNRHAIAVQADFTGVATDSASKVNKIFLRSGPDFQVQDGNACDQTGAFFELPITSANCANCAGEGLPAPTFTEYQVRARVLGKPRGRAKITSCVEMLEINSATQAQVATSLCSVGTQNVFVGTRNVGDGAVQNQWNNVSPRLLTVCVDKSGDGVCDDRIGLFDSSGKDYWWSMDTGGRPHVQLVFLPVASGGGGSSSEPPPEPTPDPTPDPEPDPTPDPEPDPDPPPILK
jgi:hypothetical protein